MASPYLGLATDGTDLGANIATVVDLTGVAASGDRRSVTEVRYGGANQWLTYNSVNRAQYPRTLLDTDTFPARAGMTVHNVSGDAALRTLLGSGSLTTGPHIVVVDHTVTYTGDYFGAFPVRAAGDAAPGGDNIVVFISKAIYDSMPGGSWVSTVCPPKVRIRSTDLANLAFFQGGSTLGSFMVSGATRGWRFIGLRFGVSSAIGSVSHLCSLGNADGSVQRSAAMCPSNVGLDRCYFDAHASCETRHAVELHCINGYVIDCGFGPNLFVINFTDSQAILGYNGPGPFRIVNNYVQGGVEFIVFGGAGSNCGMPADVEARYNYCTRPTSWYGTSKKVKTGFEIKKVAYMLFEGNIVENVWPQSQVGYGFLLKSESYGDAATIGTTHDLIVRANLVRNVAGGVNIAGVSNPADPITNPAVRVISMGNLYLVGGGIFNAAGNPFVGAGNSTGSGSIHDTFVSIGAVNAVAMPDTVSSGFLLMDSIFGPTGYGLKGGSVAEGSATVTQYFVGGTVSKCIFTGRTDGGSTPYPVGNYFPANEAAIQYTDAAAKDYSLLGTTQSGGAVPGVPPLPAAPYAASLRIVTQPAGSTSGVALTTQPAAEILDQYGNRFSSTATITATSDSGSVTETGNTKAAVAGLSTFTALNLTNAGATVATPITFTSPGLTSAQSDSVSVVTVVASPVATALEIVQQPNGATSGSRLTQQPILRTIDQYGNPITSTATITAEIVTTGTATITNGRFKALVAGLATWVELAMNATADTDAAVLFTSPGLTSVQSNAFPVTVFAPPPPDPVPEPDPEPPPAPDPEPPIPPTEDPVPAQLVITRQPGPASRLYSGKKWPQQPVVEARDINGALMTSFSGAVTAYILSGTATLKGTAIVYAIGGVCRWTNLGASGLPGASFVLAFTDGPIPGHDV